MTTFDFIGMDFNNRVSMFNVNGFRASVHVSFSDSVSDGVHSMLIDKKSPNTKWIPQVVFFGKKNTLKHPALQENFRGLGITLRKT